MPKEDMASKSFGFLKIAEKRITIYPINPIKETGIPKSVDKGPLVTASQFITALI